MKRGIFAVVAVATVAASPASAKWRAVGPSKADVAAALNRKAEADLVHYVRREPAGSAAGHIVPVQRITGLICTVHNDAGRRSAECQFTAHYPARRENHVATFHFVGGWRLLDDRVQ